VDTCAYVRVRGDYRVTKGRGKRLRIEIRCRQRFDWPDVRFRLLDVTDADETSHVPPPACADFSVCNDRSTLQVTCGCNANVVICMRVR
jgi:hypothetical protein